MIFSRAVSAKSSKPVLIESFLNGEKQILHFGRTYLDAVEEFFPVPMKLALRSRRRRLSLH